MAAEMTVEFRRPWDESKAEAIVDHGVPAGVQREALAIGARDEFALGGWRVWKSGLGRQSRHGAVEVLAVCLGAGGEPGGRFTFVASRGVELDFLSAARRRSARPKPRDTDELWKLFLQL
jgi:hypothetical protein